MKIFLSVVKDQKNSRIILATLLLGLVFLAGFSYESHTSYKSEIFRAKIETVNLSKVLQEQINSSLKSADLVLQELQSDVNEARAKGTFRTEYFNKIFLQGTSKLDHIKSFKAVDRNGNFIADDSGVQSSLNLTDRQYFQDLKKRNTNELIISKPVISKTSQVWVIVLARRLIDQKGNFDGVILGTIPLSYFRGQFEKLNLGRKGLIGLYDTDLEVYARTPWVEERIGTKGVMRPAFKDFFSNPNKIYLTLMNESRIDQVSRMTTIRKLEAYPLVVVVGLSSVEYMTSWKQRTIIYACSIVLIFAAFLYFLIIFLKSQDDLEDQRHQAIQASKLSSLGEMAGGIAHEINNPLTIISALATRAKKNLADPTISIDKSLDNLNKIIFTVDRIAKIIRGLRSFARDSNGDKFARKSVKEIIDMTLDLCQERLKDNGVDVRLDSIIDTEINCREVQIVQILMNLLNNSLDAILDLPEKWILISTIETSSEVIIRITDSGPGIEKEIAEKMMMPFFTTKDIGKGTGLGLSISKGIIDSHSGEFYYEFHEGHTSFVIKLAI